MKLTIVLVALMLIAPRVLASDDAPWGQEKNGLASRLSLVTEKPAIGQPLRLRLEVKCTGAAAAKFDDQQASVNGSLAVTGPDGREIPFIGGSVQTSGGATALNPGNSKTIFDNFDVFDQYLIQTPGQYRIQSRSRGGVPESNALTVTIGPGKLSDFQSLLAVLHKITPNGWRIANYSGSIVFLSAPTGLKADATSVTLFISKEPTGGPKPIRGQPAPINLGETKLGHAWLIAESKAAVERWPDYSQVIGDKVRAMPK